MDLLSANDLRQARELLETYRRVPDVAAREAAASQAQVWVNIHNAEQFERYVTEYRRKL